MTDVLIAGAGPAGAATAYLLASRGIDVTLVERETDFDRVFRGEGLMPSGVDALYQMGLDSALDDLPFRHVVGEMLHHLHAHVLEVPYHLNLAVGEILHELNPAIDEAQIVRALIGRHCLRRLLFCDGRHGGMIPGEQPE